jgi:hypothetical protein
VFSVHILLVEFMHISLPRECPIEESPIEERKREKERERETERDGE